MVIISCSGLEEGLLIDICYRYDWGRLHMTSRNGRRGSKNITFERRHSGDGFWGQTLPTLSVFFKFARVFKKKKAVKKNNPPPPPSKNFWMRP